MKVQYAEGLLSLIMQVANRFRHYDADSVCSGSLMPAHPHSAYTMKPSLRKRTHQISIHALYKMTSERGQPLYKGQIKRWIPMVSTIRRFHCSIQKQCVIIITIIIETSAMLQYCITNATKVVILIRESLRIL